MGYQQKLAALAIPAPTGPLPVPGTTNFAPGSAAEAQWYQQQLTAIAAQGQLAELAGRKKRSIPVPGTILDLHLALLLRLIGMLLNLNTSVNLFTVFSQNIWALCN